MVDPVLTAFLITLIVLFTVGLLIFVVPLSIRPLLRGKKGARAELKPVDEEGEEVEDEREDGREHAVPQLDAACITVEKAIDLRLRPEAMARVQGRLNTYITFSINGRYMRTRIAQDTTSPTFNESFWVEIDRSSAATQELSMTVWHHSAHGEADVRVGVGFYNLKKLKAGDPKIKEFVLGSHRHPTGVVKVEIKIGRRNAHHRVLMETRAFKPQSLGAWPAHGGFVGLAPSMMGDEKWRGLLKTLQPRLANAALRNINAPHRLMMLLQGSPVLAAYGLIASGGTTLPDLDADDDDDAADVPFRSVPIELEVELPKEHPEVVKKVRIEGGTRAVTFFQAAFGRPMQSADDILAYHQQHAGIMGADVWLNLFCKAIALALNGTRYESLRVWREKERLRVIEERDHARAIAASLARQAAQQAGSDTTAAAAGVVFEALGGGLAGEIGAGVVAVADEIGGAVGAAVDVGRRLLKRSSTLTGAILPSPTSGGEASPAPASGGGFSRLKAGFKRGSHEQAAIPPPTPIEAIAASADMTPRSAAISKRLVPAAGDAASPGGAAAEPLCGGATATRARAARRARQKGVGVARARASLRAPRRGGHGGGRAGAGGRAGGGGCARGGGRGDTEERVGGAGKEGRRDGDGAGDARPSDVDRRCRAARAWVGAEGGEGVGRGAEDERGEGPAGDVDGPEGAADLDAAQPVGVGARPLRRRA